MRNSSPPRADSEGTYVVAKPAASSFRPPTPVVDPHVDSGSDHGPVALVVEREGIVGCLEHRTVPFPTEANRGEDREGKKKEEARTPRKAIGGWGAPSDSASAGRVLRQKSAAAAHFSGPAVRAIAYLADCRVA